jgi:hypothetical protein
VIQRTLVVAICLSIGAAVFSGLYWLFLSTPESNVWMLTVSVILALFMVTVIAVTINVALLIALGGAIKHSIAVGPRRVGWVIAAALPLALLVWVIMRGDAWVAARAGEINAWFIATFGWADASALFAAQSYLSIWLRWVFLPVLAIAALSGLLQRSAEPPRVDGPRQWVRAAWNWRTLLVATLAFALLVVLPWRAAFWQTSGLPWRWLEPSIAAIRLAAVAALISIGYALIVVTTARQLAQGMGNVEK